MSLDSLFEQFLRERIYLRNVTTKTREWYESAWRAFTTSCGEPDLPNTISRADLARFVVHLRERGVRPVSCNTWLRALNAFCRWLHEQGHASKLERLQPQRLEKRLIETLAERSLRLILTFRPSGFAQTRVHVIAVTILDTGCRIQELLTARTSNFVLDQMLLTVDGKGRKERCVPFSTELPKVLSVRTTKGSQRGSRRCDVPGTPRDGVGAAQRPTELLPAARSTRAPTIGLSSPAVRG